MAVPVAPPATHELGGIDVTPLDKEAAARLIVAAAASRQAPRHVHLVNAYTLALADRDTGYRDQLRAADGWCFADGRPLGWASGLLRQRPPIRQVRGTDLFLAVVDQGRTAGLTHYLLGSTPVTLAALERELARRYPGVLIVGRESPPFRPLSEPEQTEQCDRIARSGAAIVWVALGTPAQDKEGTRIARDVPGVTVAVGAAFDFVAGTVPQAPRWMQVSGLEWAYRLAREPRRLWRRYLFGNAGFVAAVVKSARNG